MSCEQHYQIFIQDNETLQPVQQISKYRNLELVLNRNGVGSWLLELDPQCGEVPWTFQNERFGIDVWRNGRRIFSGPILAIRRTKQGEQRSLYLGGTDWNMYLFIRLVLPSPYYFTVSYATPYYQKTGPVETIIKDMVNRNLGPAAVGSRQHPLVIIETDQGRGDSLTHKARFPYLGNELKKLLYHLPGYNFALEQNSWGRLEFKLKPWAKRWNGRAGVEFSARAGNVVNYDYSVEAPEYNKVLVGGGRDTGGDPAKDSPEYRKFAFSGNEYSRARFGDREYFIDRRGTTDTNELKQEAWSALRLDKGKEHPDRNAYGKISVVAEILDKPGGPRWGIDYDLGDYVRCVLEYDPSGNAVVYVEDYIKQIKIKLEEEKGETINALVGSDDYISSVRSPFPFIMDAIARIKERLQNLEGEY
jgi:hypothetical protein